MRAARIEETGLRGPRLREIDPPLVGDDEVLIHVRTVGINQLDFNVIDGVGPGRAARLPRTLGLDPAGVITAVGSRVDTARVGERVVVKPNVPCGSCRHCDRLNEADCTNQTVVGVHRDGGAAELVAVPARSAFPIGDLDFGTASVAVHSVSIALHALRVAGVGPGMSVLVTGASGALGGAAVELSRHLGAQVIAVSRRGLPDWDSVTRLTVANPDDIPVEVRSVLPAGVDVAFDSSGHAGVTSAAVRALGWAGYAVFCSASLSTELAIDSRDFYLQRKTLRGCASADYGDVTDALALVGSRAVNPRISKRYGLDEITEAYATYAEPRDPGKVVIDVT